MRRSIDKNVGPEEWVPAFLLAGTSSVSCSDNPGAGGPNRTVRNIVEPNRMKGAEEVQRIGATKDDQGPTTTTTTRGRLSQDLPAEHLRRRIAPNYPSRFQYLEFGSAS